MNEFKWLHLPKEFKYMKGDQLAYGVVSGYHVMIQYYPKMNQYTAIFSVSADDRADELQQFLQRFAAERKYVTYVNYSGEKAVIHFKPKWKEAQQQVSELLTTVSTYFRQNQYLETCCACGCQNDYETGKIVPVGIYQLNNNFDIMCEACFQTRRSSVQSLPQKSTNLVAGIVGAVFGALIGVAVWLLIYRIGFIAGITGLIMVVFSMKGFELLGGRLNKQGVVISLILCAFMIFVAEYLSLGMEVYIQYGSYFDITVMDAVRSVPAILTDPIAGGEIVLAMIEDLVLGYVFMIVAAFPYVRRLIHNMGNENVFQRIA